MNTSEWHTGDIQVHVSDIRWIRVHTSCIPLNATTYEWHANDIQVYTDHIRAHTSGILMIYENMRVNTIDIRNIKLYKDCKKTRS